MLFMLYIRMGESGRYVLNHWGYIPNLHPDYIFTSRRKSSLDWDSPGEGPNLHFPFQLELREKSTRARYDPIILITGASYYHSDSGCITNILKRKVIKKKQEH
jgi:hypothetical protein